MSDEALEMDAMAEIRALQVELQRTRLAYHRVMELAQFHAGFLARTSHELRSPINSVISLHQLILSDLADSPEEERDFIAQSFGAAEKMLGVLDQLIHVSKMLHGIEALNLQPVQLQDILKTVQQLTHLQADNRNLRLEVALPDADLYVLADPKILQQVLVSLVDTPIGLMREGTVRVTVTAIAPAVHISIEDDRPSHFWSEPTDLLERLRSGAEPLEALPSPGLTLWVNQTFMELMNGKLEILAIPSAESDLTRIQCMIPLVQEDPL